MDPTTSDATTPDTRPEVSASAGLPQSLATPAARDRSAAAAEAVFQLADVSVSYGGVAAVEDVTFDLLELSATLGSDVPFFALDRGAARAQGRGERLATVSLPRLELVLANLVHVGLIMRRKKNMDSDVSRCACKKRQSQGRNLSSCCP